MVGTRPTHPICKRSATFVTGTHPSQTCALHRPSSLLSPLANPEVDESRLATAGNGTRGGRAPTSDLLSWLPFRFVSASQTRLPERTRCLQRAVGGAASRRKHAASYIPTAVRASSRSNAYAVSETGRCASATCAKESGRSSGSAFDQR